MTDQKTIETPLYVIKKHGYFYRPGAHGYTSSFVEAWKVDFAEAKKHEYKSKEDPVTIHLVSEFADTEQGRYWAATEAKIRGLSIDLTASNLREAELSKALKLIAEGVAVTFRSSDPLRMASDTIEALQTIAKAALHHHASQNNPKETKA